MTSSFRCRRINNWGTFTGSGVFSLTVGWSIKFSGEKVR